MNNKSCLMLDIDGVLLIDNDYNGKKVHPTLFGKQGQKVHPFNKKCVKVLNEILEETNADIVLSSDWKHHFTVDQLNEIFIWNNVNSVVSDITKSYYKTKHFSDSRYLNEYRASEILHYVKERNIITYAVVDDLHMEEWLDGNFVFCGRGNEGIKQTGIKEKIIKILKPIL